MLFTFSPYVSWNMLTETNRSFYFRTSFNRKET